MVEFLKPFREETVKLQAEDYPTLPLVVPCKSKLQRHCLPKVFETAAQEALRERAGGLIETKLRTTMQQKIATFLWPKYRQLLMLPVNEREEVWVCYFGERYALCIHCTVYKDLTRRYFQVFQEVRRTLDRDRGSDDPTSTPPSPDHDVPPPSAKRRKVDVDDGYDEWECAEPEQVDEVASYLKSAPKVDIADLYGYWKTQLSVNAFPRYFWHSTQLWTPSAVR